MYTEKATWLYFIYLNQTSVPVDKAVSRGWPTAKARRQRKSVIVCPSHHWRATEFRRRHGAAGRRCWEAAATAEETTSCRSRVAAAAVAIIVTCPPPLPGRPSTEGCRPSPLCSRQRCSSSMGGRRRRWHTSQLTGCCVTIPQCRR